MDKLIKKIKMKVGYVLFITAECLMIDLGRFAPIVFGWMMGSVGQRVVPTKEAMK